MKEQFKTFLSQLSETNATLDYFVDFEKVIGNVRKIALKLNQLNYLIGKDNFTILFQMFITLPLWLSLLKKVKKEKTIKF